MQPTLARSLVLAARHHAMDARQPPPGLRHPSDRGSHYASREDHALLRHAQLCGK